MIMTLITQMHMVRARASVVAMLVDNVASIIRTANCSLPYQTLAREERLVGSAYLLDNI